MSLPNLSHVLVELAKQTRSRIEGLELHDPMKVWLLHELTRISSQETSSLPHRDFDSRFQDLKQLQLLLFQHSHKVQQSMTADGTQYRIEPSLSRDSVLQNLDLQNDDSENDDSDQVSLSDKMACHLRGLDPGLKFEFQNHLDEQGQQALQQLGIDSLISRQAAIIFLSRYHAINNVLASQPVSQIVELASGHSPRGFQWASMVPGTIFIETGQPDSINRKANLLSNHISQTKLAMRGTLRFCPVDPLDIDSLIGSLDSLDPKQACSIVTEGLLANMDRSETTKFWDHMSVVLKRFPNCSWISDIVTQQDRSGLKTQFPQVANALDKISAVEHAKESPFQTIDDVHQWTTKYGLNIQQATSLSNIDLDAIEIDPTKQSAILGGRRVWRFRATQL